MMNKMFFGSWYLGFVGDDLLGLVQSHILPKWWSELDGDFHPMGSQSVKKNHLKNKSKDKTPINLGFSVKFHSHLCFQKWVVEKMNVKKKVNFLR